MADETLIKGEFSALEITADDSSKISVLTLKISDLEKYEILREAEEYKQLIEELKDSVNKLSDENMELKSKVSEAECIKCKRPATQGCKVELGQLDPQNFEVQHPIPKHITPEISETRFGSISMEIEHSSNSNEETPRSQLLQSLAISMESEHSSNSNEKNSTSQSSQSVVISMESEHSSNSNENNSTSQSSQSLAISMESEHSSNSNEKNSTSESLQSLTDSMEIEHSSNSNVETPRSQLLQSLLISMESEHSSNSNEETPTSQSLQSLSISMESANSSNSNEETPTSQSLQSLAISSQMQMSLKERLDVILSVGEECIREKELESLLANKPHPICYDGFEPSGRMHIAQGVMKAINVNKLTSAGCKVKIWIADWFAQINKKMGGDLKKIQVVGQYLIEIWKAVGMNLDNVEFLWASEEINSRSDEYFCFLLDIAKRNTLSRIIRCGQIMGRSEKEELTAAQIFYPCMQCADIFFLKADICQLGMDQRKVNVLAREYCDDIKRKNKPIILSHHMLPGLQGQEKMSKSDPSSAIYMEDEEADVNLKIENASCPLEDVVNNPCLQYIKYIVLPWFNEFTVERELDNGGDKTFKSFEDIAGDYISGKLKPGDLKQALSKAVNRILQPVRDHFSTDPKAKELLKRVKSYKVTR